MISAPWNKLLFDPRLIFGVTLVLVLILAYQLSILVWQIIPQPDLPFNPSVSPAKSEVKNSAELSLSQKIEQISRQHLFGKPVNVKTSNTAVQNAPKSSLNYKVRGIYYSTEQSLASVILQKSTRKSQFYRLGDEIDAEVYISQIHPDYVLISRRGKLEKLLLEKPKANLKGKPVRALNSSMAVTSGAKVLNSYRRRYKDNPMALAKRFQAKPVQENGKNIGYKLKALRGETLMKKLDLQDDDVFVEINGIGLDKPFQALDALKSLTTAQNVSVTVLRNGNRETMDFNLQ